MKVRANPSAYASNYEGPLYPLVPSTQPTPPAITGGKGNACDVGAHAGGRWRPRCEQSAVACSVVGFFGIAANAAVGIWSNCLAHLIYRSVCVDFAQTKLQRAQEALYGIPKHKQEATLPQSSKETRFGMVRYYTRLYSVVGWLLPLAIGLLGLGWSTQNVGLAKVGWLYPNGDLTTDPSPNLRITQP